VEPSGPGGVERGAKKSAQKGAKRNAKKNAKKGRRTEIWLQVCGPAVGAENPSLGIKSSY